jgi:hypothetical protein
MLQKIDLASIAEEIESPYRAIPLVSLDGLEVSLFICQGAKSWRRQLSHEHALFVIEGEITIDGSTGKTRVDEGELAVIASDVGHGVYSGMRSSVVLIEETESSSSSNGHRPLAESSGRHVVRSGVAGAVRGAEPYDWMDCGSAGRYSIAASRLVGASADYVAPSGSLVLIVFRGMLDYESDDESGSAVGSQMLVVPHNTRLTFNSPHGATVVALSRHGALPPESVALRSSDRESEDAD